MEVRNDRDIEQQDADGFGDKSANAIVLRSL